MTLKFVRLEVVISREQIQNLINWPTPLIALTIFLKKETATLNKREWLQKLGLLDLLIHEQNLFPLVSTSYMLRAMPRVNYFLHLKKKAKI